MWRKTWATREVETMRQEHSEKVEDLKQNAILVNGKRVSAWSNESAQLALAELNGRVGDNGMIIWPKGTVEKLLIERSKYKDIVRKHERAKREAEQAAKKASETASQAVAEITAAAKAQTGADHDPAWTVNDWIESLEIEHVLGAFLLERLREKGTDPHFEQAFISRLGRCTVGEATTIIHGLLEPHTADGKSFVKAISERVAAGAVSVSKEMLQQKKADSLMKPQTAGKFFLPDIPEGAGSGGKGGGGKDGRSSAGDASRTLQFGDPHDFYAGLESLVGKPDPISLSAGMRREHVEAKDSQIDFTAHNYGTTTTSEVEYHFVVEPTPAALARLGRSAWPIETKLDNDASSKHLCRRPSPLSEFDGVRTELEGLCARVVGRKLEFSTDQLVAARLYTGPSFVKYNGVLRTAPLADAKKIMETLTKGNRYPTTLHTINAALSALSALTKCQSVYRGVGAAMVPESFVQPNEVDAFKGGVEYGFMSTTCNRDVALRYAKGEHGLLFEIWMGMADRGADLSRISQYPHEAEICFPPLTALEVRGQSVDNSLTILEIDARISSAAVTHDEQTALDIKRFREVDANASGELDRHEFNQLAKKLVPRASVEMMDQAFQRADSDQSGLINFQEFRDAQDGMRQLELQSAAAAAEARARSEHQRELSAHGDAIQRQLQETLDAKVSANRKAVAGVAAEMLFSYGLDRFSPSTTRTRALSKLARAIEATSLVEHPSVKATTRIKEGSTRRARSSSPRRISNERMGGPGLGNEPSGPRRVGGTASSTPRPAALLEPRPVTPRLDLRDFVPTPARYGA